MSVLPAVLAGLAVLTLMGLPRPAVARIEGLRAGAAAGPAASSGRGVVPVAAVVTAGVAGLLWAGPVPAALLVGGALLATRAGAARREAQQQARERGRAIEACAALAGELRAGRSAGEALSAAADLADGASRAAFTAAAAAARGGGDVPLALLAAASPGGPSPPTAVPELLRGLAACWAVCSSAGSGLAAAVERLEEGLRAAQAQRQAVEAELAGPRATAAMLALLPLAGLALASGLGANPLHVLLHTPVGLVCLVLGVALDLLGLHWTGRLVARAGGR